MKISMVASDRLSREVERLTEGVKLSEKHATAQPVVAHNNVEGSKEPKNANQNPPTLQKS